jgi:hypothetical protein
MAKKKATSKKGTASKGYYRDPNGNLGASSIVGDSRAFVPRSADYTKQIDFRYSMLPFGNCSDEECEGK